MDVVADTADIKEFSLYSYYMFNKPYGCVSARRDDTFPTVMDYFKELDNPNLSPVGRLDRETEGLLLITDDGKWNQIMTHPSNKKEKQYSFIAMGILNEEKIKLLENGVMLTGSDKTTAPAKLKITGTSILSKIGLTSLMKTPPYIISTLFTRVINAILLPKKSKIKNIDKNRICALLFL